MARLIKERNEKLYAKEVLLEDNPEKLKALTDKTRWKILNLLAERPRYPASIAKELGIHEQKVYYHMNVLEKNDLVKVKGKQEKGGAVAKYYTLKNYGFALELPYGDEKLVDFPLQRQDKNLKNFLHPFVSNGKLNAKVVVGSPDPHGPYQVRSRDGHFAVDLALFLGQYASVKDGFSTKLDVNVKAENSYEENLILVGGVLTNLITQEVNPYLPIKFNLEKFPFREITSEKTGKNYTEDSCGVIAKIPNPDKMGKSVLTLAGVRYRGTRSAILALTKFHNKILKDYEGEDNWARVIKGKDMDGDGKVDEIEILE